MRLTSNVLTGMDVCLDSAPARSMFLLLLLGKLKPVSPTWDIFVKYIFVPELMKEEKKYIVSPNCSPQMLLCVYFFCLHAKSLQSCPILCNPVDCSPPTSLSMGFSRQEYWSGLPCPPPGDLPKPRDRTYVSYISCIGRQVLYH